MNNFKIHCGTPQKKNEQNKELWCTAGSNSRSVCAQLVTIINILEWSSTTVLHTNPQLGVPERTCKKKKRKKKHCKAEYVIGLEALVPTCGSCRSRPQCFCACTPSSWWSPAGCRWCHHLNRHIRVFTFWSSHDGHLEPTAERKQANNVPS